LFDTSKKVYMLQGKHKVLQMFLNQIAYDTHYAYLCVYEDFDTGMIMSGYFDKTGTDSLGRKIVEIKPHVEEYAWGEF
jgi:hypothetical protein